MRRFALLALATSLPVAAAAAPPALGDVVGTDAATIASTLAAAGCTVSDLDREVAHFEMLCTTEAGRWEVYVDAATGAVTKLESADW
jgi:hypothetical protein